MPDVQCRACGGRFHEITDKFDPEAVVRGDMFRLKDMFKKQGWDSFLENPGVTGDQIGCPECGASYCDPLKSPFARGVRVYKELAAVQEAPPPSPLPPPDVAEQSSPPGPRELVVRPPEKRFKNRRHGKEHGSMEPV